MANVALFPLFRTYDIPYKVALNVFLLPHSAIEAQKHKVSFYTYETDFKQNKQLQK